MNRYDLQIGTLLNDAQLRAISFTDAQEKALKLSNELVTACMPRYGLSILECARMIYDASKSQTWLELCSYLRQARDRLPKVTIPS